MEQWEILLNDKYARDEAHEAYELEYVGWKCGDDLCETPDQLEPGSDIIGETAVCHCGCSLAPYDFKTDRWV